MGRMTRREVIVARKLEADTERAADGRKGWFGIVRKNGRRIWTSDIVTTLSEAREMADRGLDEVAQAEANA